MRLNLIKAGLGGRSVSLCPWVITPAFGYSAPHSSAEGTLTPMIHALPSAHYGWVRLPVFVHHRLSDFPSRCGPGRTHWPNAGSPKFRRDPFARDVLSDPGRVAMASHSGHSHVAFGRRSSASRTTRWGLLCLTARPDAACEEKRRGRRARSSAPAGFSTARLQAVKKACAACVLTSDAPEGPDDLDRRAALAFLRDRLTFPNALDRDDRFTDGAGLSLSLLDEIDRELRNHARSTLTSRKTPPRRRCGIGRWPGSCSSGRRAVIR
jgi:hypothetical protein